MLRFPVVLLCAVVTLIACFVPAIQPDHAQAASATVSTDSELRSAADWAATTVQVLPAGSSLTITGPPTGEFYPVAVASSGTAGWVPAASLIIAKDTTAPAVDEPTQPAATEAALSPVGSEEPAPTTAATAVPTSAPSVVPSPTAEPTTPPTPFPRLNGPATATVNLNLHAETNAQSEILFVVPAGSTLTRTGQYVNGWVSADFMGVVGWVDSSLLAEPLPAVSEAEILEPSTATPNEAESEVEPAGVGGPGSGHAFATTELNLRSGPSASYDTIDTVPAGARVELTGVMEGGFVRVTFHDQVGWVETSLLSMPADPTPATSRRGEDARRVYSREEIVQVIYAAADRYEQPRADMLRVAECESNLDPYAVNPSGSYGLFQFISSTWESTPYAEKDVFDPRANANAAGWMWSVGRRGEWVCQ